MTLLIASLFVEDAADLRRHTDAAFAAGAEAVELRIDGFEGEPATLAGFLNSSRERRWIVTCRSAEQGGSYRGDTMQRVSRLIAVARHSGAYVDFEWTDWRRSANIRQKVLLACAPGPDQPPRLILSHHDQAGLPTEWRRQVADMFAEPAASVVKVAYPAHADEGFAALDLMREFGSRMIAIAMGEEGFWTRVLARKFGTWGSFAALSEKTPTAAGQCSIGRMQSLFGWSKIASDTKVFGVIGDPIAHSLSPLLHNAWFSRHGVRAVYLPFQVPAEQGGFVRFLEGCAARPWLDIGGFSVTAPHKETLLKWAGAEPDRLVQSLGAANTLVWSADAIRAHNTDAHAAVDSLCAAWSIERRDLRRFSVDILGAGGTGRAIALTLGGLGCRVTIYDRQWERAERVAVAAGGRALPWNEVASGDGDILINATSSAAPGDDASPSLEKAPLHDGRGSVWSDMIGRRRLVFDVNYRPARSSLVRAAEKAGVSVVNGMDMFLRQAAMQFALWTGVDPDIEFGRRLLKEFRATEPEEPYGDGKWKSGNGVSP